MIILITDAIKRCFPEPVLLPEKYLFQYKSSSSISSKVDLSQTEKAPYISTKVTSWQI